MRIGTNCFTSREAATAYYAVYGFDEIDVDHKIKVGEIAIGIAHLMIDEARGDKLTPDREGRYWLETEREGK